MGFFSWVPKPGWFYACGVGLPQLRVGGTRLPQLLGVNTVEGQNMLEFALDKLT